jgi:hypothetical protein
MCAWCAPEGQTPRVHASTARSYMGYQRFSYMGYQRLLTRASPR